MRLSLFLLLKISALTTFFLILVAFKPNERIHPEAQASLTPPQQLTHSLVEYDEYNIRKDAYVRSSHSVKKRDTFSDILDQFNVPATTIATLVDIAKPHLDVRKIRAGNKYITYHQSQPDAVPDFFIYEKGPIEYVVFDLRDSLTVETGKKTIRTVTKHISGSIESSLYQTLSDQDANPMVAIELSEIFAWQVDFYRIMKGDNFKVVYEEEYVENQPIGIGKIIAANFTHAGEEYSAFPFELEGNTEFYNDEGNSLRRPFLKAPLRFNRISSRYSLRRFHPVQKRYKAHLGTDYAAPTGTPVRSTADGTVVEAGYTKGNGRYVKVKHNGTYTTGYLHFSKIAKGIKKGVRVKQGDVIGYVGSTGLATGPHLCYRFWKNGKQVDALREKLPDTVESIREEYLSDFLDQVSRLKPVLEGNLANLSNPPKPLIYRPLLEDVYTFQ
ncbi:MAG: peptidoglycan DD-metalloendopeptidase family protein [Rhodothermaceae bacterium]|nr:peptidoglycan DD-metalloendopeptidase family protein [Rhodothermaceae bacterium]